MDEAAVAEWVKRYERAWETNDPADIGGLFAEDARYYSTPDEEPWWGRDGIVANWLDAKDEPGTWTFRFQVLAATGDLGIVRGWARYTEPPADYSNLWVIRFEDAGRCTEFTEWWIERQEPSPEE